jgi:hypothetical protein
VAPRTRDPRMGFSGHLATSLPWPRQRSTSSRPSSLAREDAQGGGGRSSVLRGGLREEDREEDHRPEKRGNDGAVMVAGPFRVSRRARLRNERHAEQHARARWQNSFAGLERS